MIPKAAFVTGNEKKWAEVQTILGEDVVKLTRANVDCTRH
jgi:inosine/xanthosine triphosphate pyrophosphatase family protein